MSKAISIFVTFLSLAALQGCKYQTGKSNLSGEGNNWRCAGRDCEEGDILEVQNQTIKMGSKRHRLHLGHEVKIVDSPKNEKQVTCHRDGNKTPYSGKTIHWSENASYIIDTFAYTDDSAEATLRADADHSDGVGTVEEQNFTITLKFSSKNAKPYPGQENTWSQLNDLRKARVDTTPSKLLDEDYFCWKSKRWGVLERALCFSPRADLDGQKLCKGKLAFKKKLNEKLLVEEARQFVNQVACEAIVKVTGKDLDCRMNKLD